MNREIARVVPPDASQGIAPAEQSRNEALLKEFFQYFEQSEDIIDLMLFLKRNTCMRLFITSEFWGNFTIYNLKVGNVVIAHICISMKDGDEQQEQGWMEVFGQTIRALIARKE